MNTLAARSIRLSNLLAGLAAVPPEQDIRISGLSQDSRRLRPGDLFCATRGLSQHGLTFWRQAQRAGAAAIAWEPPYTDLPSTKLPLLAVERLGQRLGLIADRFYDTPAHALPLIGVTGTDGKTSCAYYIAQALQAGGSVCGLLGTLGHGLFGDELQDAGLTTPDVLTIRRWLAAVRDGGGSYAVMEVSSHALDQGRVQGLPYPVAVLTNLGRDHLDYHPDVAHYAAAKRRLFTDYQPRHCVLNLDDAFGQELAAELGQSDDKLIVYSGSAQPRQKHYIYASRITCAPQGLCITLESSWGQGRLDSSLLGRFNASNLLAALGALLAVGLSWQDALQRLSTVHNAPGRMERIGAKTGQPLAVVDYAHTPQALEQALQALREHGAQQLWCVFGCGGDRDPGKRPLMGAIAERLADRVVITDDNPRREDPQQIIDQILGGMQAPKSVQAMPGREQAIRYALNQARSGDIVLLAGKGHENYQLIGEQRLPFDDRLIAQACLQERAA